MTADPPLQFILKQKKNNSVSDKQYQGAWWLLRGRVHIQSGLF